MPVGFPWPGMLYSSQRALGMRRAGGRFVLGRRRPSHDVTFAKRVALSVSRGDVAEVVALRNHRAGPWSAISLSGVWVLLLLELPKIRFCPMLV